MSSDIYNDDWDKMKVAVKHYGLVVWYPTGEFVTSCEVDAFHLPFDRQDCSVIVTDLVNWEEYNNLTAFKEKPSYENARQSNEWTLLDANTAENHFKVDKSPQAEVVFTLSLKRQSSYYIITIILPITGLSVVGLMVFLLPPDSGEKISLSVACMMAFFITQMTIAEHLPSSWNRMPIISKFSIKTFYYLNAMCYCNILITLATKYG